MGFSQDAEVFAENAEVALLRLLYSRDFFRARVDAYALVAAYSVVMMYFDPFEYTCSDANPCLGCGFRAGIQLLLDGHLAEGLARNPLIAPVIAVAFLAVLDLLVAAVHWAASRGR